MEDSSDLKITALQISFSDVNGAENVLILLHQCTIFLTPKVGLTFFRITFTDDGSMPAGYESKLHPQKDGGLNQPLRNYARNVCYDKSYVSHGCNIT